MKNPAAFLAKPFFLFRKNAPLPYYILGRLIMMAVTLFILGFAIFGLAALAPGENASRVMLRQNLSGELAEAQRMEPGLDRPFYVQYARWLGQLILHRDLGLSLESRTPVSFLIGTRLFNSLLLNVISLLFITFFSFLLGTYLASRAGTGIDLAVTFFALALNAFPGILLLILLELFASLTGLFPVSAYPPFPFRDAPGDFVFSYAHHVFLPLLASFLGGIGGALRMIRKTMLDQLAEPYIMSLRSRGISERRIYLAHAFRNTWKLYISGSAKFLAGLFSASLILEIIFAYPGIGLLMYEAVMQEDMNLVLAIFMFISFLVLLGMVISDISLALVKPNTRYGKDGV